jgi:hypothetical protein
VSSRKKARACHPSGAGKRTDVGYGRPPREHQFKPGQSGNKRGRPKGSKNEGTIMSELFNRRIEIRQNGSVRKISLLEGIFIKFAEDALKGNAKSAAFLLNRKLLVEPPDQPASGTVLDVDDQKVLEFYSRQLEERLNKRGEEE